MHRIQGLSLIELLVVVAIIAILGTAALPAFLQLTRSIQVKQAHADLRQSLILARSEAIRRGARVALHAGQGQWEKGWLIFGDDNANGIADTGETVLRETIPSGTAYTIRNTGAGVVSVITYDRDGRSLQPNGAFLARTLAVCDGMATSSGYKLVIAYGGRVRSERLAPGAPECN